MIFRKYILNSFYTKNLYILYIYIITIKIADSKSAEIYDYGLFIIVLIDNGNMVTWHR